MDLIAYGYFIAMFYLNAFVLTPRLLYSRRYWYYLLSVLGLFAIKIAVFYPLVHLVHTANMYDVGFPPTYAVANFFVMVFFLALSTSYRTIRDKIQTDRPAPRTSARNTSARSSTFSAFADQPPFHVQCAEQHRGPRCAHEIGSAGTHHFQAVQPDALHAVPGRRPEDFTPERRPITCKSYISISSS